MSYVRRYIIDVLEINFNGSIIDNISRIESFLKKEYRVFFDYDKKSFSLIFQGDNSKEPIEIKQGGFIVLVPNGDFNFTLYDTKTPFEKDYLKI